MTDEPSRSGDGAISGARRKQVPLWRKLLPLLGLVLLGVVLSQLDRAQMAAALDHVSLEVLGLAFVTFSLNNFIKAFRWHRMLVAQGLPLPPKVTLAAFLAGAFYGLVTLGRVGELYRAEALIERGASVGVAMASSVLDRLLDVFVVLLLSAVLGALVLGNAQVAAIALALMLAGGMATWLFLAELGAPEPSPRVAALFYALGRVPVVARSQRFVRDLATGMHPMAQPKRLAEALLWTVIGWTLYFETLFVLADGLKIAVSRAVLTGTGAFAALSSLLPITVSGLGARELIYIGVLHEYGIENEPAVAMSLLHLLVMTTSATVFGVLGAFWRSRQRA
jgi:uncharacterized protein (TIRG00374 family)